MSAEKLREAFESWAAKETPPYRLEWIPGFEYSWGSSRSVWEAFKAGAASVPTAEPVARDREADRLSFGDPDFNRWLDESITENGEFTVWHSLKSTLDAYLGFAACLDYISKAEPVAQWVSVDERLPEPGRTVLVSYTTHHTPPRQRINRAAWVPAKFEEADSESDNFEYDEATDTNWTPQGWYEQIDHWDEYSAVMISDVTVTHWMPLPPAPAAAKGERDDQQRTRTDRRHPLQES